MNPCVGFKPRWLIFWLSMTFMPDAEDCCEAEMLYARFSASVSVARQESSARKAATHTSEKSSAGGPMYSCACNVASNRVIRTFESATRPVAELNSGLGLCVTASCNQ